MTSGNGIVRSIYRFFKKLVINILYHLPKKYMRGIWFKKQHGYKMDFNNPRTLDEKLNWLLVNYIGKEHAIYADKVGVREFVVQKGLGDLLPEIYGVWSHADEVPLDKLPNKFVLKCNHASGKLYYEIVTDKSVVNWNAVLSRMERMLHTNYARPHCEYQYDFITPCIYAEELLVDGRGARMTDYKVFCYYGKPHCIMACTGREGKLRKAFYDTNWKYLDYSKSPAQGDNQLECPKGLDIMLEASEVLAKEFPFARIDFYDVDGRVYFGEITLTPANCNLRHLNEKAQRLLGELLDLKPFMQ